MKMQFDMRMDNSELMIQAASQQIQKALKTIGLKAEGYAKKNCPVDTGRLRNSITHQNDKDTVYIGTNVEYAVYVEMGTRNMKAQPYLGKAIVENVDEYKKIVEESLK